MLRLVKQPNFDYDSHGAPSEIDLTQSLVTTLGRNPSDATQGAVYLNSKTRPQMISRVHAKVSRLASGDYHLSARGLNGVAVNNVKVEDVLLKDGDVVCFGAAGGLPIGAAVDTTKSEITYIFTIPKDPAELSLSGQHTSRAASGVSSLMDLLSGDNSPGGSLSSAAVQFPVVSAPYTAIDSSVVDSTSGSTSGPAASLSSSSSSSSSASSLAAAAAAAAAAPSQPIDISTAARERRSSSVSSTSPPLAVTASIIGTPPHTANTPTATHNKPAAASAASGAVQPSHTSMAMAGAPPASSSSTSPTSAVAPAAVGGIGGMGGIGGTAVVPQSPRDMSTAVPQVERKSSDLGIARLYSDKSLGSKQLSSERGSISGSGSFSGSKTPQPPKTNPFKSSITSNDRSANEILDLEPGESDSQTDKEYVLVTNPVASLLLTPGDAKIAQDVYMEAMAQRAVAVADFADSKLEGGRVLEAYALLLKALDLFHRAMAMTPSVTDASPKLQEIYDSCRHRFVISLSKTEKLKSQVENAHKTIGQNNTVSAEKLLYDFAFQLGRDAALDEWWGDLSRAQHRCQQAIAMLEVLLLEKGMGETDKRVLKEYLAAFVARMEEMRRKSISPSRQQG
eukprot:GILK01004838.1.p1 GENE.GILK01004838.1~~GILK01004838.1.p1  ORF type:complete len:622 (+),score=114.34 GILK01004838.1:71-1936(+)